MVEVFIMGRGYFLRAKSQEPRAKRHGGKVNLKIG
jgi:hypothetical protein